MTDLPQTLAEALEAEAAIAERAAKIRAEAVADGGKGLTPGMFMLLWPLLCEPIPPAFIKSVPKVEGKPYPSTGVSSVQVQIERMDAVLTPLWWWYEDEYALEGKLCTVTVFIGDRNAQVTPIQKAGEALSGIQRPGVLLARSSKGGVQRGSTIGNIYKGSFTNAAKLAFARIGPGHEVYVGAIDLDPDVSPEAAEAPASDSGRIGKELAAKLVDHAWKGGEKNRLRLAASKLAERDVGDCSTKPKATEALTGALTFGQAESLDAWLLERGSDGRS